MLIAVTDHAAERFRQRVRGTLDAKVDIAARVARARAAAERVLADDPTLSAHPGLLDAIDRRVGQQERAALAKN